MPAVNDLTATIEQELTNLTNLPAPVRRWIIEIGDDATNEMAVWVWAVLDDASITRDVTIRLRNLIFDTVSHVFPNAKWVYVRFRASSEVE